MLDGLAFCSRRICGDRLRQIDRRKQPEDWRSALWALKNHKPNVAIIHIQAAHKELYERAADALDNPIEVGKIHLLYEMMFAAFLDLLEEYYFGTV